MSMPRQSRVGRMGWVREATLPRHTGTRNKGKKGLKRKEMVGGFPGGVGAYYQHVKCLLFMHSM